MSDAVYPRLTSIAVVVLSEMGFEIVYLPDDLACRVEHSVCALDRNVTVINRRVELVQ